MERRARSKHTKKIVQVDVWDDIPYISDVLKIPAGRFIVERGAHLKHTKKKTSVQVDVSERRAHSEAHHKMCRYTFWSARRSSDVRRTSGGRWLVERSARSEQTTSALVNVLERAAQIEFDKN